MTENAWGSSWLTLLFLVSLIAGAPNSQPKFSPCAAWQTNASTFADRNMVGTSPYDVFVTRNGTAYVASPSLRRVQAWRLGNMTVISNISSAMSSPYAVFVADSGDLYVDNGRTSGRVDKWTSGSTNSTRAMVVPGGCFSLFLDHNNSLYCSLGDLFRVVKRLFNANANSTTTVAGTGFTGSASDRLNLPRGIIVDLSFNLYVADCGNDRVQLFPLGQLNGTTVAGASAIGTMPLDCPLGIALDADDYLFIVECFSNRVIGSGPLGFRCIAACTGLSGSAADQLAHPRMLDFDDYGNLFVVDSNNNRIQKFLLQTNSCSETSSTDFKPTAIQSTSPSSANLLSTIVESTTVQATSSSSTDLLSADVESTTVQFISPSTTNLLSTNVESTTVQTTSPSSTNLPTTDFESTPVQSTSPSSTGLHSTDVVSTSVQSTTFPFTNPQSGTFQSTITVTNWHTSVSNAGPSETVPTTSVFLAETTSRSFHTNISSTLCQILKPCLNNGICVDNKSIPREYTCSCSPGFDGVYCQLDHRPCQPHRCWNRGICNQTSNTTFKCLCLSHWDGTHCEIPVNYCENVTCHNNGVCRSLLTNYTCECLSRSYSGRYCEITSSALVLRRVVSRSLGYIAILAISAVAIFIVAMDLLKYCFGINPTRRELRRTRRSKQTTNKYTPSVAIRFIYVNS